MIQTSIRWRVPLLGGAAVTSTRLRLAFEPLPRLSILKMPSFLSRDVTGEQTLQRWLTFSSTPSMCLKSGWRMDAPWYKEPTQCEGQERWWGSFTTEIHFLLFWSLHHDSLKAVSLSLKKEKGITDNANKCTFNTQYQWKILLQLETVIRKAILLIHGILAKMSTSPSPGMLSDTPDWGTCCGSRFFCWDGARSGKTEKPLETGGG